MLDSKKIMSHEPIPYDKLVTDFENKPVYCRNFDCYGLIQLDYDSEASTRDKSVFRPMLLWLNESIPTTMDIMLRRLTIYELF